MGEPLYEVDRTHWPAGPWDDERDVYEMQLSGFRCLLARVRMGHWCGYVGVPVGHPWHGLDRLELQALRVHGDVTWAASAVGVLSEALPPDLWWVGFDCGHSHDLSPRMLSYESELSPEAVRAFAHAMQSYRDGGTYRTKDYALQQVERLVLQALEAAQ